MFAQLGSIPFQGLKGFTQFDESRTTVFARHERIGGKPRLQLTGIDLNTLSITILLHASFTNPETDFAQLDQAREAGTILPLILANGVYVSDYVIETMDRSILQTDQQSNIVSMSVSLSLLEHFDENPQQSLATAAKQRAYATGDSTTSPLRVLRPLPPTLGQSAAYDVQRMSMDAGSMSATVDRAEINPAERPYLSQQMTKKLNGITTRVQDLQQKLTNPALLSLAGPLPTTLPGVAAAANNLLAIMPMDSNFGEVRTLLGALQNTVRTSVGAAGILKNAVIVRSI